MNTLKVIRRIIELTTVITLSFIFACGALAQEISWLDINGQRWFSSLQEGYDNTLFALQYNYMTNYSSVFYSRDTGYSWTKHSFNYNDVYNYSTSGDWIVMERYIDRSINPHQVFLSTDRGVTFTRILSEDYFWHDAVTITDSQEIFAVFGGNYGSPNAYISQYKDGTWSLIGNVLPISIRIRRFFIDGRGNFIINGYEGFGGVIISTDRGITWNRSLETKNISVVTADPDNNLIAAGMNTSEAVPSGLYRSTDHGVSWTMLVETGDLYFNSLAADDSGNIFGATQRNILVYRMSDGTTEEVAPLQGGFESILLMSDGSVIASSYDYGIYHSKDKGMSWIPHSPRAEDIYSITLTSRGTVIVGTLGNGILRSTNVGGTWEHISPVNFPPYVYSLYQGNNSLIAGTEEGVYRSSDDGITWDACNQSYFSGSVNAVCGKDNGDIFIGTNFGIYRSTNDGSDWTLSGLDGIQVMFLASDDSGRVYAAAPTAGIFYLNENINSNWINIGPVFDDIQSLAVNSTGQIFAGVYGGVYVRNRDTGVWEKISFTNSYVYSLSINRDQDILAGTYGGVYISRSNGLSWSFAGLPGSTVMSMDFDLEQNLFAGIFRGGVFRSAVAVTSVDTDMVALPREAALSQNYPNPFNPYTRISYSIPQKSHVSLKIFNSIGQEIVCPVDERRDPGSYELVWNGGEYPSGLYFTQLRVDGVIVKIIKMLLIK